MSEVPCFRCLLVEELKARVCNPEDCSELTSWLFDSRLMDEKDVPHPLLPRPTSTPEIRRLFVEDKLIAVSVGDALSRQPKCPYCGSFQTISARSSISILVPYFAHYPNPILRMSPQRL
jgi:hypothetical protein